MRRAFLNKIINAPLHWQILTAMVLGFSVAMTLKLGSIEPGWFGSFSAALGSLFLRLLKMVIVPLVLSSIVVGVAGVGDSKNLGRLGIKTFVYYMTTSMLAVGLGLALCTAIKPGVGVDLNWNNELSRQTPETPGSLFDVVERMIPINPIQAMVEADMLAIIFFAIVLGAAITRLPDPHKQRLVTGFDAFFQAMMKLTTGVIRLAPIGVYGLIFRAVTEFDNWDMALAIGKYYLTIASGLTIHLFLILPVLYYLFIGRNPIGHYRHMTDAMLTAFSTSSSSATLPVTMECVEEKAGVSNRISSFVLPMGSTINMDGTALYECAGVLFIAQVLGMDLSLGQQVILALTALLASIGAAGIPSSGLVMIFIVLDAVGIEGEMVGVIVGTMLAVDRPLDMYRTVINIFSDSVGVSIIAHSEGELAEEPS